MVTVASRKSDGRVSLLVSGRRLGDVPVVGEEVTMSLLRRRPDDAGTTRAERRAAKEEAAREADRAARVARAQRRLAQATGPLPVIEPRMSDDDAAPARRSPLQS